MYTPSVVVSSDVVADVVVAAEVSREVEEAEVAASQNISCHFSKSLSYFWGTSIFLSIKEKIHH